MNKEQADSLEADLRREALIRESIAFMQAVIAEYGAEKGEEMWDTIVTTLDPSVKRQILMKMLVGDFAGKIVLRGFRGEPKKVNAIKAVREVTGLGLKEAKEIVDAGFGNYDRDRSYSSFEITLGVPTEFTVQPDKRQQAIKLLESVGCVIA